MDKLVSIGLPVYNGSKTIRRALDALLAQTHKNFELIISDNASTDETGHICEEYAARDSRIIYIRQKENIGGLLNFQFVAERASGDYFMWASDDDWWDPGFIDALYLVLDSSPGHQVAMSSYQLVYPDGKITEVKYTGELDLTNDSFYGVYKKMMAGEPTIMYILGLFRTPFFRALTRRPMASCIGQDRILMCEAALAGHFYSVPEVLYIKAMAGGPVKFHHAKDAIGRFYSARFPYIKSLFTNLTWLVFSKMIPWHRKPLIFWPWLRLVWYRLPRMRHEIVKTIKLEK